MKVKAKKGAKSEGLTLKADADSFIGKMIAGTTGKVTFRTPFGKQVINAKDQEKEKEV